MLHQEVLPQPLAWVEVMQLEQRPDVERRSVYGSTPLKPGGAGDRK
jgi:hypothetical protein